MPITVKTRATNGNRAASNCRKAVIKRYYDCVWLPKRHCCMLSLLLQAVHFLNCCNNISNSCSALAGNDSVCKLWTCASTGDTEQDSVCSAALKIVIDFLLNIAILIFMNFRLKSNFLFWYYFPLIHNRWRDSCRCACAQLIDVASPLEIFKRKTNDLFVPQQCNRVYLCSTKIPKKNKKSAVAQKALNLFIFLKTTAYINV